MATANVSLESQICEAATGEPCGGLLANFGVQSQTFFDVASAQRPTVGNKVVVTLDDPFNVGFTDVRTIVLAFDNDPQKIVRAKQQEGTTAAYDIPFDAANVHLWINREDVTATIRIMTTADANKLLQQLDDEPSLIETFTGKVAAEIEKERQRQTRMLIGAAVFVLALAGLAAYALPRIKLPTGVNVG